MISVFIVDDHPVVVEGIQSLLANEKDIHLAGHALTAAACQEFFVHQSADVILMDINLPDKSGLDLCAELKTSRPHVKILALTTIDQPSYIQKMMANGASGYVMKNCGKEEMIGAIYAVASGETFLSPEVSDIVTKATEKREGLPRLTRREKEILGLIVEGLTNGEIAARLFVSQWTIDSHRKSLMAKFNTKNTAQLVKYAYENGLIEFNG